LIRSILLAALKGAGALLLGGAILWEVAVNCGPPFGIVYVHVSPGDGDLAIDDVTYHVRSLEETPIVRKLQPGSHMLRLSRNGGVVFEQEFSLNSGEELVLTAWDRSAQESQLEPPPVDPAVTGKY
jgi:hypothetical protein